MSCPASAVSHNPLRRFVSSNSFLAGTLALAAVLRVAHILSLMRVPVFDVLILDSWMYDEWAKRIASGDWLGGQRAFYMDPLYPYFLAVLYWLFGRELLLVRVVQAVFGVGTCALVAALGRGVASRTVGNIAALLLAVCRPAIFQEGEIEKTALGMFLVTAAIFLALRKSLGSTFAAGAIMGLAALVRGNLLIFGPLGTAYYLFRSGPGPSPRPYTRLTAYPAVSALVFFGGFLVVVAPVTWRNYYVSGDWVITTSGAGANFYTGNNSTNRSGAFEPVPFVRPHPAFEEEDFRAAAEQRLGRRLRASEVSAYWFRQAWVHLHDHPGFALTVVARKAMLFWSDFEMPDGWDMYLLARYSLVLALFPIGMGWLLPLAIVGATVGFRKSPEVRLLVGYIVTYSATVIAFFIFSRYRIYVFPALAVLAALGLRWIIEVILSHDLQKCVAAALIAAIAGALSFFGLGLTRVKPADPAQGFMNLAAVYYEKGDAASAERLLGDALAEFPNSPAALCGMGRFQLAKGNWFLSVALLRQCLSRNPRYPQGWFSLGQAYYAGGKLTEAARAYQKQIEVVPGHLEAARLLLDVQHQLLR
ncbi:MAG: glycosyltransferase family 39 protein [Deltaproteobacteria bacterium]|nr:glycosyltransferase family 39 protein [Deltaproteobacteria bacterium]